MIVVDASMAVKLVVEEPLTAQAVARMTADEDRIAPDWIRIEVANAVVRKVRHTALPADAALDAVSHLPFFLTERVPSDDLLDEAMALALQLEHSVYDCLYLALAVRRGIVVVTADAKFVRAAERGGYAANVELLA